MVITEKTDQYIINQYIERSIINESYYYSVNESNLITTIEIAQRCENEIVCDDCCLNNHSFVMFNGSKKKKPFQRLFGGFHMIWHKVPSFASSVFRN